MGVDICKIYVDILGSHEIILGRGYETNSDRGMGLPQTEVQYFLRQG